eukprot:CAMPEP_0114519570 /NCGR_PEP_ID=MMETSP0109-20121206/19086_1 /TAXON_ID=29199 /ORGANISM="Chlorarachnion reptans, Strain CCCM449" /LENGTH=308 /DNA_ID=CAMNT_0001700343 /DNA_START=89 /DNA_END=1015 /DNA_ORIENTATION=-
MLVWSYPSIDSTHGKVLAARSGMEDGKTTDAYRWSKLGDTWQYMLTFPIDDVKKSRVKSACIVVLADQFNPEKFQQLLEALAKMFKPVVSPKPLMEAYLHLFRKNEIAGWADKTFDNRRALIGGSIKAAVKAFGKQCALLWTAVVLKRRIFVYAESVSELLGLVRVIPLFGSWHRQDWGILRPIICLGDTELEDLKKSQVYVAGCTDSRCSSKSEYYDLFIDATSGKMTVPPHMKASMKMGRIHTDWADAVTKAAATESDQGIIKVIAVKTKNLIDHVKKIREKLQPDQLENDDQKFFLDVAVAEGLA